MLIQVSINTTTSKPRGGVASDKASQPPAAKGRSRCCVNVANFKLLMIRGAKAIHVGAFMNVSGKSVANAAPTCPKCGKCAAKNGYK